MGRRSAERSFLVVAVQPLVTPLRFVCFLLLIASAAYGQTYGLLLGFTPKPGTEVTGPIGGSDLPPGPIPGYGTLWIALNESEVRSTILRDIIVPRRDGFWRLGGDLAIFQSEHEEDVEVFLWAGPTNAQHQPAKLDQAACEQFSYDQVPTWINPEYVSVAVFRSATCTHYDENQDAYVFKLDEPEERSGDGGPSTAACPCHTRYNRCAAGRARSAPGEQRQREREGRGGRLRELVRLG